VATERGRAEKASASLGEERPTSARTAAPSGYPKTHSVIKGDSYWALASRYYGDGSLLHVIEKANPGIKLRPGMKITIPEPPAGSGAAAVAGSGAAPAAPPRAPGKPAAPPASASRDYLVQRGDTLGTIARKFYGDASKLHLIEQANPDLRYQMLQAGTRIKVPAGEE
jgi:membrane-bound lytic murein transglycosylase D